MSKQLILTYNATVLRYTNENNGNLNTTQKINIFKCIAYALYETANEILKQGDIEKVNEYLNKLENASNCAKSNKESIETLIEEAGKDKSSVNISGWWKIFRDSGFRKDLVRRVKEIVNEINNEEKKRLAETKQDPAVVSNTTNKEYATLKNQKEQLLIRYNKLKTEYDRIFNENEKLRLEIKHKDETLKSKDETLKSKDQTIDILQSRSNK